jgi:predicted site-specific integrase-resolvase
MNPLAEARDPDSVSSFDEWCERVGISPATGRRLIAAGKGPTITRLSERRMGIRERHHLEWLDGRARQQRPAA